VQDLEEKVRTLGRDLKAANEKLVSFNNEKNLSIRASDQKLQEYYQNEKKML